MSLRLRRVEEFSSLSLRDNLGTHAGAGSLSNSGAICVRFGQDNTGGWTMSARSMSSWRGSSQSPDATLWSPSLADADIIALNLDRASC
jgi:hypothetical protein